MEYKLFSDHQWLKLYQFLCAESRIYLGSEEAIRHFMEAVAWINRSGSQWRFLPPAYGNWNSVYKRFARWETHGVWERMFLATQNDPDMEHLLCDGTIIRAHPCAAGASSKKRTLDRRAFPFSIFKGNR